jgi:Spy/CpxP family protein refolding chaperone
MRVRTFLSAAVLAVSSVGLIWAQPRQDMLKLHQELKLTEQQEEKLQELHFNLAKEMIQLRAQLQMARLDMQRMMAEDEVEREMILNQVEQISKIQAEMKKLQIEKQLAFREILDKKQLAKLKELRMERKHFFMKRRFHRGHGKNFGPGPGRGQNRPMIGETPVEPEVPPASEEALIPELGLLLEPFPEFDLMTEPIPLMEEHPEIE